MFREEGTCSHVITLQAGVAFEFLQKRWSLVELREVGTSFRDLESSRSMA